MLNSLLGDYLALPPKAVLQIPGSLRFATTVAGRVQLLERRAHCRLFGQAVTPKGACQF